MPAPLLLKGFEVEMYTGRPDGQVVGCAAEAARAVHGADLLVVRPLEGLLGALEDALSHPDTPVEGCLHPLFLVLGAL